ncbi:EAL domain-containing protein [Acetobacterium tundrae]|uniref:EAL domain-containing protein n=1 Tax=Acetobacterium tundrae TaxID=132932 RepID=A0ABR6WJ25_9FIRM|nr:EAL domain-containing protein [Acetobacterium tundrae]MBC3796221.1 EAL domain-containing protein [Acetobacterium tundrae]
MEKAALLFSLLFFILFVIYVVLGFYVYMSAPQKAINRISLALLLALSLWTLSFSIAISAPSYATCLFWRRIAALGWGSFFGILLHASLILTEKKNLLKKWWLYLGIYLPAVVIIFAFSISNDLTHTLFNLADTQWGWINFAKNTVWDMLFAVYYITYSITSLILIFLWGHRSTDENKKKQGRLIGFSLGMALILGTLIDTLGNTFFLITTPQLAPIVMVIPFLAIYYSIRRYELINTSFPKNEEVLFTEISKKKIYDYLSIASIIGGGINFISQYYFAENPDLFHILFLSVVLFLFSVLLQAVQHFDLTENQNDIICVGLMALLIPIITFQFIGYAGITVWAFPFILILGFLIFSRKILLFMLSVSILLTQVLVWIFASTMTVKVESADYLGRIGLLCLAICLAYYLNKIFVTRLNETTQKMKLQELLTQISSECVVINQHNFEEKIGNILKMCCDFFSLDRTHISIFDYEENSFSCIQDYCRESIMSEMNLIQHVPINRSHWRIKKLLDNELFVVSDINELPSFTSDGLKELGLTKLKSQIMVPISSKEKVIGFWGFDSETRIIHWRDDHINFAKIMANIIGDTLTRIDTEKEINFMAHYDEITKLPNRNLFTNFVYFNIIKQEFTEKKMGIIFVDLDSFRTVNETVGHRMGDELLFMVGEKLKSVLNTSDIISRFSGDEFLIMLDNLENEAAIIQIAKSIINLFKEPFLLKGQEFFISASAGIALYPIDGKDAETLIMNADIAKSRAREKGRNQYVLCSSEIKSAVKKEMQLTSHLYRALENGELYLEYQPQVSLHTGKITGVESLLRWKHPQLGIISPSVMIPLAEQTGLINPIGEWVLENACCQNKIWQDRGIPAILMAVNISASQFKNPLFIRQVEQVLKKTGLKPEFLEIEITESIAIMEFSEIVGKLIEIKDLGISIAIDDFGTEYSSLGRLKELPIHRIKMDKQFVDGIGQNHKDQAIATAIIDLGKSLGLSVVAEGAEFEDQVAFLKTSQCDEIQGFYYYKPLNAAIIEKILKNEE